MDRNADRVAERLGALADGDRVMSFRAVLWAFEQHLPPLTKLILTVLASHASTQDGSCFPSVRTIAREASVSRRTVHRHLPVLELKQLARVERQFAGRARRPHKYWLPCPSTLRDGQTKTPGAASGRSPRDSRDHSKNHYLNHKFSGRGSRRERATPSQISEQQAQCELARRLGKNGWEILAEFHQEVPRLTAQLRKGTLTQADLLDLRARFIMGGGCR